MINKNLFKNLFLLFSVFSVVSCSTDDSEIDSETPEEGKYNTKVYITDAPVDNAEVKSVFITVADVKVNGNSIEGFQKSTIEISSLTNGDTELLGELELESGTTSSISLVLENDTDASGTSPANYVLTESGQKKVLTTSSNEITISDDAVIEETDDNSLVLDFDLRKALVIDQSGNYSFVSNSRLSNSIRAVNTLSAGTITGKVSNFTAADSDAVVAFAYEKGTYSSSEAEATGGESTFSNAVTSSIVNESSGEFSIHFLESGDYELHFVSFSDEDNNGQLEVQGELQATSVTDLNLLNLSIGSSSNISVEVLLTGL